MANVTLSIDDSLLQAARVRAIKEGTSVNEICRRAIEVYARRQDDRLTCYRANPFQPAAAHEKPARAYRPGTTATPRKSRKRRR